MSQRVAVVVDRGGTFGETPDQERDSILEDLRRRMGLDPVLVHYGHDPMQIPDTQIDLLVVDYGMIAINGSDWTRYLLRWAEDRPSSMLLIWSSMTADGFVDELADTLKRQGQDVIEGGDWTPPWPANVRAMDAGNKWYAKWGDEGEDWLGASYEYVRRWFGLEGETPLDREVREAGPLVPPGDVEPTAVQLLDPFDDSLVGEVVLVEPTPRVTDVKLETSGADGGLIGSLLSVTIVEPKDVTPVPATHALADAPCPSQIGHDFVAEGGTRCRFCPATRERPEYYWGVCGRCLREGSWALPDHQRCAPCGEYQARCTCEPRVIPAHPTLDGAPLLVGDRVRVKGREPTPGWGIADGVVTQIRWVRSSDYLWIEVGGKNEVFGVGDLERWEAKS